MARSSPIELVIFDCDGVLVDSDRISLRVQAEWISALGIETSYEDCVRDFLGLGMPATLRILTERMGRPLPSGWEEGLAAAVREAFQVELRPVPGIVEALEEIDLPTCVASSGSHEKMRFTLFRGGSRAWQAGTSRDVGARLLARGRRETRARGRQDLRIDGGAARASDPAPAPLSVQPGRLR